MKAVQDRRETLSVVNRKAYSELLGNALLVCLSTAFVFVVIEFTLRMLPLDSSRRIHERQKVAKGEEEVHPRGLYTLHPEIGWTLTPRFSGEFKKDDFQIHVQANADGLRDVDYGEKKKGTIRILGLGDSFAFGWGVENEESLFKVLERELNSTQMAKPSLGTSARNDARFEVVNAGIAGFGTYEASALTKAIGLKYAPDLAVLAFYEGNDYRNSGDAPREREIRDGYLADVTKQESAFLRFLTKNSVLAALIESRVASISQKMRFSRDFEKTKKHLLDLKTILDQKKIPLVLMFIPDQDSAVYARPDFKWKLDRFLGGMNMMDARLALEQFCGENGIEFFRLSKEFEGKEQSAGLRLKDTHFNSVGHQRAAHELFSFLTNGVLEEEFLR